MTMENKGAISDASESHVVADVTTQNEDTGKSNQDRSVDPSHASLKYSLLGPSLTKAGQQAVDQSKVCPSCYLCSLSQPFRG